MKKFKKDERSDNSEGLPPVESLIRRELLTWIPPLVLSVSLPAHAVTSEVEALSCGSAPILVASVASKCSGVPPIGQAVLTILSDGVDPATNVVEIRSIAIIGAAASDMIVLPSLPANVTEAVGVDIEWVGNSTDAVTCLPLSAISFEVGYGCAGVSDVTTIVLDMTTALADAL